MAWPTSRGVLRRAMKVTTKPTPISSSAQSVIRKAMSCTVTVVPMSAPRITPRVWRNVIRPAETKPISINVVAAEDWMMEVTSAPDATAARRVRDITVRSWRSRPPMARCRLSPLRRMPYSRSAVPPNSARRMLTARAGRRGWRAADARGRGRRPGAPCR
jgi:hypothetical protein